MTIKQLGGVFGRNPTFNDVTIEGELTFDGDIDINSDLKVSGELEVIGNINSTGRMRAAGGSDQGTQLNMWTTVGGDGSLAAYQLVFNTGPNDARVEGARFTPSGNLAFVSGKGIDFSATAGTGTSELFDDYEEGVWTPTLLGSASNPTVTYGLQRGVYTIVGRAVTVTCNLTWSAYSGGSGDAYVGGLPFSVESAIGAYGGAAISAADNITNVASRDNLGLYLISGTTSARLQCFGSATTTQTIITSSVGSSGQLVFSASYQI